MTNLYELSLGTHGHMKCVFNGTLRSQDTIMLLLYKRVFPKWTYDPHVARPSPMYATEDFEPKAEQEEEEDDHFIKMRDRSLMPPPAKKPKHVHFKSVTQ